MRNPNAPNQNGVPAAFNQKLICSWTPKVTLSVSPVSVCKWGFVKTGVGQTVWQNQTKACFSASMGQLKNWAHNLKYTSSCLPDNYLWNFISHTALGSSIKPRHTISFRKIWQRRISRHQMWTDDMRGNDWWQQNTASIPSHCGKSSLAWNGRRANEFWAISYLPCSLELSQCV